MYRQALKVLPTYVHAIAAQAALAAQHGNHRAAIRGYRTATSRLPLPAYFIALAHSLEAMSRRGDAEAAFDQAAAIIDAQTANGVLTELARAELLLARGGDARRALALARRGFAAAPNTEAEATLSWALLENGHCERAQAYSKRSLRLGTRNVIAFEHRSRSRHASEITGPLRCGSSGPDRRRRPPKRRGGGRRPPPRSLLMPRG